MMPLVFRLGFLATMAVALVLLQSRPAAAQYPPGDGFMPGPGHEQPSDTPILDRLRRRIAESRTQDKPNPPPFNALPAFPIAVDHDADHEEEDAATVRVRVPNDAEVWFNDVKTKKTGESRRFITPALEDGKRYSYDIRAKWAKDGKTVEHTRTIQLYAGDRLTVDFRHEAVLPPPKEKKP
jgi:uncharacterized protein (TIGR03000 family)